MNWFNKFIIFIHSIFDGNELKYPSIEDYTCLCDIDCLCQYHYEQLKLKRAKEWFKGLLWQR